MSAPAASPRSVYPSASQGWAPESHTKLPASLGAMRKVGTPGRRRVLLTRQDTRSHGPVHPLWLPTLAASPLLLSTQSVRREQQKFPKGARSCGLAGAYLLRRVRAAELGRARASGAAACLLASCPQPGRRPLGVAGGDRTFTHTTGGPAGVHPLLPSLLAGGRRWALQGTRARSFTALAPAPSAPRPCAPSRGRGASEALGWRALRPYGGPPLPRPIPEGSAPGSCKPLPTCRPFPSQRFGGFCACPG